jgi:hypothetical protein
MCVAGVAHRASLPRHRLAVSDQFVYLRIIDTIELFEAVISYSTVCYTAVLQYQYAFTESSDNAKADICDPDALALPVQLLSPNICVGKCLYVLTRVHADRLKVSPMICLST